MKNENGWLARDMSGALYFYERGKKPRKFASRIGGKMGIWYVGNYRPIWIKDELNIFRNVKWEDESPTEITITIN